MNELQKARAQVLALQSSERIMREALQKIAKWEEFPGVVGPWTYGEFFGSNGERDYMRRVATDALKQSHPQPLDDSVPEVRV